MYTIYVDFQGSKSIQEYYFPSLGKDFLAKLDELENYKGKIDNFAVFLGKKSAIEHGQAVWGRMPKEVLVNPVTNIYVGIRRARRLAKG